MKVKIEASYLGRDSYGSQHGAFLSWPAEDSIEDVFFKLAEKFKTAPAGAKFVITTEA